MLELLEQHRTTIDSLCREYGVRRLELFGSGARGDFNPVESDLDFFVEFHDQGWKGSFKRYMGLKLSLESLLGKPVDLVELECVTNRYFIEKATQHRRLLYAA